MTVSIASGTERLELVVHRLIGDGSVKQGRSDHVQHVEGSIVGSPVVDCVFDSPFSPVASIGRQQDPVAHVTRHTGAQ